jgi:hypothetical protein
MGQGSEAEVQKIFCMLHTVDLVTKHAIGILKRKKNTIVQDDCPPLNTFRKRILSMAKYIMDKHHKWRFDVLVNFAQRNFNCSCSRIVVPNATRVAGYYFMIKSCLQVKCPLVFLKNNAPTNMDMANELILDQKEWEQCAEIECILSKLTVLNMDMQTDFPARQGLTAYEISLTYVNLFSDDIEFDVVDVSKMWSPETKYDDIPRIYLKLGALHDITKTLLTRLQDEYKRYLLTLDTDTMIATVVHPIACSVGFL